MVVSLVEKEGAIQQVVNLLPVEVKKRKLMQQLQELEIRALRLSQAMVQTTGVVRLAQEVVKSARNGHLSIPINTAELQQVTQAVASATTICAATQMGNPLFGATPRIPTHDGSIAINSRQALQHG